MAVPLKELIPIDRNSDTPVYMQIANAIILSIRRGRLRRGARLPGSRELAGLLNVHRKTLQTAYDELMAQGWIEISPRKGAFVVEKLPELKPTAISAERAGGDYPDETCFRLEKTKGARFPEFNLQETRSLILDEGLPDVRIAPTEELFREYRSLSRRSAFRKYFNYGGPTGTALLLETLSEHLNETRALPISGKNLLITRGAQMAFYLASRTLLKPGDHVIVGEPGYFNVNLTFRKAGATVHTVPVDRYGISVDAIERICTKNKVRIVYAVPHHHYPTTVGLIPERRLRLLDLAGKFRFAIIEDDYDYDFDYSSRPILPMASLDDRGSVIYVGTLTKTLAPAVRIGFMAAPANLIEAASQYRRALDWQGDSMMETAIAGLYRNGTITRHIKKAVKLYRARRDNLCDLLRTRLSDRVSFEVPDGGMAVWTKFRTAPLESVAAEALQKGLRINDGRLYNAEGKNYNCTRLGFASLNFAEQEKAVSILHDSFK